VLKPGRVFIYELVIAMPAKLLIVDDEPLIVELLKRWVSSCGDFDVRIAYDGIEAISIARSFRPNGVLTGIMMPKMDGVEETRRILSFLPDCKFIVVSSNAHVQEYRDALAALGIDPKFLLQKPLELHELVSALKLAGFSVAHSPASMPKDSSKDKTVDEEISNSH
jgi:CheY-like chemotaxis protein